MVLVDVQDSGESIAAVSLADLLAQLPKAERKRFNRSWRFTRETLALANLVLCQPRPGLETAAQFEDLLAFALWRLRLARRDIRRARTGHYEGIPA